MCRLCLGQGAAPAFPAPRFLLKGGKSPPGTAARGREGRMVLGMKDNPRAGMERCRMQPEDVRCFQAYNSWCWLMEKRDVSREGSAFGSGTVWGQSEPLGMKLLCHEELPCSGLTALSITTSSVLLYPNFPVCGSSQAGRVSISIHQSIPSGKCWIICWAVSCGFVKQVAEVWFSKILFHPLHPKCRAVDGSPK